MQIVDNSLNDTWSIANQGKAAAARPWVIQARIAGPADIVVYEYGARLDANCRAAATEQIDKARRLYNKLIGSIRTVHGEMNAWVLERAGPRAQVLHHQIATLEHEIATARTAADGGILRQLVPQRIALGTELTALLRPVRQAHRADIRSLFFSRVGNTTATLTYRLRCQAVDDGLGWATANAVLDSALLAWNKSLDLGRAPKFAVGDRKDQDSLSLQFTIKNGLPAERVFDGSSLEVHLTPPAAADRRAYGQFRFRLGLARDGVYATGTWQYHRPLPTGAHVSGARLIRRRVADKDRWTLQLVLRLEVPIHIECEHPVDLAAVHFGWVAVEGGRRVATIARSADPAAVQTLVMPASIETDLTHCASLQGQRALAKTALLPHLRATAIGAVDLPVPVLTELDSIAALPAQRVAIARIYRLQKALADTGGRGPDSMPGCARTAGNGKPR